MGRNDKLRAIFRNAGFYEGLCCKCGMGIVDFKPLPERIICGYCQQVEEMLLADIQVSGKFQ